MQSLKHCLLVTGRWSLSAVFSCLFGATAHASEFSIIPSIAVGEEYTDNVFQTQTDKKTEFITHLTPGLAFNYRAPFWDWDLAYLLDYRYYARNSQGGSFPIIWIQKGICGSLRIWFFSMSAILIKRYLWT